MNHKPCKCRTLQGPAIFRVYLWRYNSGGGVYGNGTSVEEAALNAKHEARQHRLKLDELAISVIRLEDSALLRELKAPKRWREIWDGYQS
jgi:hypothetical protein